MTARLVHGTSLCLKGCGILIQGPSGSGKSDLALRLLYDSSAQLIADDYTLVQKEEPKKEGDDTSPWVLTCPSETEGLLEARGLGVVRFPVDKRSSQAPLTFIVTLSEEGPSRLPSPKKCPLFQVPLYTLRAFENSLVAKVCLLSDQFPFIPTQLEDAENLRTFIT